VAVAAAAAKKIIILEMLGTDSDHRYLEEILRVVMLRRVGTLDSHT
jgi:hypothetical protein